MEQLEKKKSCVLFRSVVEAAEELDINEALELLLNYAHLGLGDEVDLDKCSKTVRLILKQNVESLDAAERRRQTAIENGNKGKDSGKKGGRPRKGETKEEAYQRRNPQETPKNPQYSSIKNPQETPKNPQYSSIKNPQKPLDVDVYVEEDVYAEVEEEKEVDKKVITTTGTTEITNTKKEETMRVEPIKENSSVFDEEERNFITVVEENKPCTKEELKNIYLNSFGEFMSNHPNLNYGLLMLNQEDSFYVCYMDLVNELIRKIDEEAHRNISKDDVLITFNNYLSHIQYSY